MQQRIDPSGTTSACAENTMHRHLRPGDNRNYLRVRGEYNDLWEHWGDKAELPPRARRIPLGCTHHVGLFGTTSACAENTFGKPSTCFFRWNYLRVRGEYWRLATRTRVLMELPPRARRIHQTRRHPRNPTGTTSACAENTGGLSTITTLDRNYLRVRGEYS